MPPVETSADTAGRQLALLAAVRRVAGDEAVGRVVEALVSAHRDPIPYTDPPRLRTPPVTRLDLAVLLASVGADPAIADRLEEDGGLRPVDAAPWGA